MLLLVACLLRLAPAPGMAASHCAPMVAGGAHHHTAAPEAPPSGHQHQHQAGDGECQHCPPSHCAQVPSCGTAGLTGTAAEGGGFGVVAALAAAVPSLHTAMASADLPPPTRPPASLLA